MTLRRTSPPGRRHRGFTLVEALVALLCLSIGLLGIAALQITGLRANVSSSWRSQATYLSYDIIDRMRANRGNRVNYVTGLGAAPAVAGVAGLDLAQWKANLAATFPGGDGTVAVGGVNNLTVTVTIQWDDSRGAEAPLVFTTQSRL